ncbi:MAG: FecR domain-containing protein [Cyanobacteria bacterium J06634_5]
MVRVRRSSLRSYFDASFVRSLLWGAFWIVLTVGSVLSSSLGAGVAEALTIRGDRWLAITELSGTVELISSQGDRQLAQTGDRLASVGDTLITGPSASARLEVDQSVGYISMAEDSQLRIQTLSITRSGGRVTELFVTRGQVRLRLRRLTNPDSRLEIHTPAGVSGVRGTEFGLTVQANGQTGVATLEGSVAASAQGETVIVAANRQSAIYPGAPPTPPAPLRDDPALFIEALIPLPNRRARIVGYTDTVNLLDVNQGRQILDRAGRFDLEVALSDARSVAVVVTTPLGTEQTYKLVVP